MENRIVRQCRGRTVVDLSVMVIDDTDEESEDVMGDEADLFERTEQRNEFFGEEDNDDDVVVLEPSVGGQEVAGEVETKKRKWLVLDDSDPDPYTFPPSDFSVSLDTFYKTTYPTAAYIAEWLAAVAHHSTNSLLSCWLTDNLVPDPKCHVTEHQITQELIRDPRMRLNPQKFKTLSTWLVKIFPSAFPTATRIPYNQLPPHSIKCRGPSEGCLRLHEILGKYKPVAHHSARVYTGVRWAGGDLIHPSNIGPTNDLGVWGHEVVFKEYERDPHPPYICNGKYVLMEGAEMIRERGPREVIKMLVELDDDVYKGCEGEMEGEEFEEWLTKDLVLVVERKSDGGKVKKLVAACVQEWRPGVDSNTEPLCFIHWLGVSCDHRHQGIASSLFHLHTPTSATLLEVHRSNTHAISLYTKLSMVPIGSSRHDKSEPWNFMFRRKTNAASTGGDLHVSPSMHDVNRLYPGVFDDLLS